jgi:hypothetical protein
MNSLQPASFRHNALGPFWPRIPKQPYANRAEEEIMKIGYVALVSVLIAAPAIAGPTTTNGGVKLECAVTGSSKDGYSIYATNTTKVKKSCTVACDLAGQSGKQTVKANGRSVNGAPEGKSESQKYEIEGQGGLKGGPFTSSDITSASCSNS